VVERETGSEGGGTEEISVKGQRLNESVVLLYC
jgi:hypothetical protein